MTKAPSTPTPATPVTLIWQGPDGHVFPYLGEDLVAGGRYQFTDVAFAAYLVDRHPEYWRRPAPPKTDAPQE